MFPTLRLHFSTILYPSNLRPATLYRISLHSTCCHHHRASVSRLLPSRHPIISLGGVFSKPTDTRNFSSCRPFEMPKAAFYVVKKGRVPGIYDTWDECEKQVTRFTGAIHKKFKSRAEAEKFLGQSGSASQDPYTIPESGATEKLSARRSSSNKGIWAVKVGRKTGVYKTWEEVEKQIDGFPGAVYKSFPHQRLAEKFLRSNSSRSVTESGDGNVESLQRANRPNPRATPFQVHAANASTRPLLNWPPGSGISSSVPSQAPLHQLAQSQGFTITRDGHLVVYTDGSSQGNGGKRAKAGSGVWWAARGHASTLNLAERLPGLPQTNNRAELLAIIRAIETCPFPELPLEIRTDSQYSISCMTKFLPAWIRNNFRLSTGQPVKNKDMIVHLLALLNQRSQSNKVRFLHVRAHVGETGNEGADVLANTGAGIRDIPPDRTDWFTHDDANRFKVGGSIQPNRTRNHTAFPASNTFLASNTASCDSTDSDSDGNDSSETLQDVAPVDVEVDPSWLLTEEDIAELEADL